MEQMGADLQTLKESARVQTCDKEVSANNLLKLQAILPGLSIEDKEQLSGLKGYLTFDAVKSMGEGFSAVEGVTLTIEGTVDRILEAYLQEIDRKIEEVKKIES